MKIDAAGRVFNSSKESDKRQCNKSQVECLLLHKINHNATDNEKIGLSFSALLPFTLLIILDSGYGKLS